LLIRHGESYANADGLAGGPIGDGGLTPLGRRQAQALVDRLSMSRELDAATAFYTSALPRAIETGEILRSGLPKVLTPVVDAGLNEISVGEGDGLPWAQYVEKYGAPDWT
jgi:probable phosphoglycerate mutase